MMSELHVWKLSTDEYRQFIMKLLNEDRDNLALKLSGMDDVIKAYFHEPKTNVYTNVELDMERKELRTPMQALVYDKYLKNEMTLLHAELKSTEMYQDIVEHVGDLKKSNGITYDDNILTGLIDHFEKNRLSVNPSQANIENLFNEQKKTEAAISEIDGLLEKIEQYRKVYMNKDEVLNNAVMNNMFEQNSKVSVYHDSWNEMKKLYETKSDLLKVSLKFETELFLNEYQSTFKNAHLNPNNLELQEYLSKTNPTDITKGKIIPLVVESNINSNRDRLLSLMDNHTVSQIVDYSLKRIDLYDPSIQYEGSILSGYIEKMKEASLQNIVQNSSIEFKNLYGEKFVETSLLTEQLISNPNKYLEMIKPAILDNTFRLYDLHEFEPTTKKDIELQKFWEGKSVELLEQSLSKKEQGLGMIRDFEERFISSDKVQVLLQRVDELADRKDDLSKKMLNGIKDQLETTKETMAALKQEIRVGLALNKEDQTFVNQNTNNLLLVKRAERDVESIQVYIDFKENENTNTFEKDFDQEL